MSKSLIQPSKAEKFIIIGGGISGLTVAYWLYKKGFDVLLLEKEDRPGGSINTERYDGYLIERGPNSTLDIYDEVDKLCEDLGILKEKIFANQAAKKRYVLKEETLIPLPMGPLQLITTDLWSIRGKLRLLYEPLIPRKKESTDESVAHFVIRRTGEEFLDYAIDPFVTGVFAGNPYQLSLKSCFPAMHSLEQEYGSLVKGTIFGKRTRKRKRKMRLFSFREGLQTLPMAMARALGSRFVAGHGVTSIKKIKEGLEVISESKRDNHKILMADRVIVATPALEAARIAHSLSELLASTLTEIEYVPVVIVFTGFDLKDIERPLDGFGFLIPTRESTKRGYKLLGSIWSSIIFPDRAPRGKVAFTNMLGGTRDPDILEYSDQELINMTLKDLNAILHIKAKPEFIRVVRHSRAIPQYNIGHEERIMLIEKCLKEIPGLYLVGNYINGVSVGHCISRAMNLAEEISSSFR